MSRSHKYDPLAQPGCIRLLELKPGVRDDPISCRLRIVSLDQAPPYEAISYTWGDPALQDHILCNEKQICVTVSLKDALSAIRLETQSRLLWADAICINQNDLGEKGSQVAIMAQIYRAATRVLVWLGPEKDDSAAAFGLIQDIVRHACHLTGKSLPDLFHSPTTNFRFGAADLPTFDSPHWSALVKFFDRPYFGRMWVIQEISAGSSATAMCGRFEIDWTLISLTAKLICNDTSARPQILAPFHTKGYFHASMLTTLRRRASRGVKQLLLVLQIGREFLASDPRDKIYALLDLICTPEALPPIIPDYTLPVSEVYRSVARKIIVHYKSLCVLYYVLHRENEGIGKEFPSWVPRWDQFRGVAPAYFANCSRATADEGMDMALISEPSLPILRLRGVYFDRVSWVDDQGSAKRSLGPDIPVKTWSDLFTVGAKYPTGEDFLDAFMQSLPGNLNCFGKPLGSDLSARRTSFRSWACRKLNDNNKPGASMFLGLQPTKLDETEECDESSFQRDFAYHYRWHRLFFTENGYTGLSPKTLRPGDECCVLFGGHVPFILRPEIDHHLLVSECYLHGVMFGEAIGKLENGELEERTFELH